MTKEDQIQITLCKALYHNPVDIETAYRALNDLAMSRENKGDGFHALILDQIADGYQRRALCIARGKELRRRNDI